MHMYLPCKREIYAKHFAPQIVPLDSENLFSLTRENSSRSQFMLYLISELVASWTFPQQREKIFRNLVPRASLPNLHEIESSRVTSLQLISRKKKKTFAERERSRKCSPSLDRIFVRVAIRMEKWSAILLERVFRGERNACIVSACVDLLMAPIAHVTRIKLSRVRPADCRILDSRVYTIVTRVSCIMYVLSCTL
jgi:hypothetical protein